MNFLYFLRLEIKRCFLSPATWVVAMLTICAPLAGYWFYKAVVFASRAGTYIANPVMAGSIGGVILFSLLTLYELSRIQENKINAITDSIVSPFTLNAVKITSLLTAATVTGILTTLVYLPYTIYKTDYLFDAGTYFGSFLIIFLPALWIACLFSAVFYQITERTDLSFILLAACAAPCFGKFMAPEFILRWINPITIYFNDIFSNSNVLRLAAYNRIFWLLLLTGTLLLSFLCLRRYGKGLTDSFIINIRYWRIPLISSLLLASGLCIYIFQPFVNHSGSDTEVRRAKNEGITILSTYTYAKPNPITGIQYGKTTIKLARKSSEPRTCKFSIDCGYKVSSITADGKSISFADLNDDYILWKQISLALPRGKFTELVITYSGYPQIWKKSMPNILANEINNRFIQLPGGSFSPIFNADKDKKISQTADIVLPGHMIPVTTTGDVKLLQSNKDSTKTWHLDFKSHDRIRVYAADYLHQKINSRGMSVEFYYGRRSKPVMDKYRLAETLKEVFDYCSKQYGPIEYTKNNTLILLQESSLGGGADKGISFFGEITFSEDSLKDPKRGASGMEVMAHEIAHQWWGLGVVFEGAYGGSNNYEWTSEGFTVFTTYRMMKEKFGADYAKKYYIDVWKKELKNRNRDFYYRRPEYLDILPERFSSKIKSQSWGVDEYCVMPLKILKAAELIGGEDKMDGIMAKLYQMKANQEDSFLSYDEFLSACHLTDKDLELK